MSGSEIGHNVYYKNLNTQINLSKSSSSPRRRTSVCVAANSIRPCVYVAANFIRPFI